MEVSSKQVWDSEDNVFLPLITELLSIKVRKPFGWSMIAFIIKSVFTVINSG